MNPRAIGSGVYMIELENKRIGKKICLYVGESVWIVARCGLHLCFLHDDPNYFGLVSDDLNNDDFILRFSVVETITGKKSVLGCGKYKQREMDAIKNNKPLTQLDTSDRQIHDPEQKK